MASAIAASIQNESWSERVLITYSARTGMMMLATPLPTAESPAAVPTSVLNQRLTSRVMPIMPPSP